ncbi:MAG: OmpH family outer membrane protein [Alphaproteobacteria bacterium]|nr:OmpH family outer membrane protein [Alphaproteobacteria bacterium]
MKSNIFKPALGLALLIGTTLHNPVLHATNEAGVKQGKASTDALLIGILDINRILNESKAAKALNTQMDSYRKTYQDEIRKHEQALRENEAKLVEEQKNLSPNDFEKKRKDFEKEVAELQKSVMAKDTGLKEAGQIAMEDIRKAVVDITQKIAREKGFKIVLPSSIPVYIDESNNVDITDRVLKGLDQKLPKVDVVVKIPGKKK